jgi:N-acetylglucosaminyl-diphospho-decaprenol L-rhamnosyltransferase
VVPVSVAAVVVHYRTPERLRASVAALSRQTRPCSELVVVDNSGLESPELGLPDTRPLMSVYRTATNRGFGAACNIGARHTSSEYLLFVNADVEPSAFACERLSNVLRSHPAVAVVGPRIYGRGGEIELSARSFPRLSTGMLGRSSLATRLMRKVARLPEGLAASTSTDETTVDWVSGACMLVRRQPFEEAGGFDEAYWMYWEDADLCRRFRDRGWDTVYCPKAEVVHWTGSSGVSRCTIESFHRSAARYYEQHVARNAVAALLARFVLRVRMRLVLRRRLGAA